jgi:hypothetical protein
MFLFPTGSYSFRLASTELRSLGYIGGYFGTNMRRPLYFLMRLYRTTATDELAFHSGLFYYVDVFGGNCTISGYASSVN